MFCVFFFTASRSSSTVNPDLNTLVAAVTFGKGKCKINVEVVLKILESLLVITGKELPGNFLKGLMSWLNLSLKYDHLKYVWHAGLPSAEKLFEVSAPRRWRVQKRGPGSPPLSHGVDPALPGWFV